MSDLADTAQRLRVVKEAYRRFLTLWALDDLVTHPATLAQIRRDMERPRSLYTRDWFSLHRGSGIDD